MTYIIERKTSDDCGYLLKSLHQKDLKLSYYLTRSLELLKELRFGEKHSIWLIILGLRDGKLKDFIRLNMFKKPSFISHRNWFSRCLEKAKKKIQKDIGSVATFSSKGGRATPTKPAYKVGNNTKESVNPSEALYCNTSLLEINTFGTKTPSRPIGSRP